MGRVQGANSCMITLARESRGLSQKELSDMLSIPQGRLSKIEHGLLNINDDLLMQLSKNLGYPEKFFYFDKKTYTPGFHFYRKFTSIPKKTLNIINAHINISRIHLERLMTAIEIKQNVPFMDITEYGTPQEIAKALRCYWKIPNGPIENLSRIIEKNGIPIITYNFGVRKFDGVSTSTDDGIHLMFLNTSTPGDRFRFTLSHELAHIIMHNLPTPNMENEANEFASAFLMPEADIKPYLSGLTLDKAASLKKYWKVSMASIIERAYGLKKITSRQRSYLWTQISKLGYKIEEPKELDIPQEKPTILSKIFDLYLSDLEYSYDDFVDLLGCEKEELLHTYGIHLPENKKPILRVVGT